MIRHLPFPALIDDDHPKEECGLFGIYGLADAGKMTQISSAELAAAAQPAPSAASPPQVSWAEGLAVALVFLAGLLIGALWRRTRRPT